MLLYKGDFLSISLKETIEKYGIIPKKSLGQNFLLHPGILHRIAKVGGGLEGKTILEIGAGPGGLTRALLEGGASHVIAVEKDPRCLPALYDLKEAWQDKLDLIQADALTLKPQSLIKENPFHIMGNLPYHIGTELLLHWVKDLTHIHSFTLMFQKEVALRITGSPNEKAYGRLSVLCQYLLHCSRSFDLPPGAFTPPPSVVSSIVHLVPKLLDGESTSLVPFLSQVTQYGFGQRRKMLRSSLSPLFKEKDIVSMGINPCLRAENLTQDDFIILAKRLKHKRSIDEN